ncbi:MAG: M28 family peptidase [Bacteroidales bacterium]|nr:M28 family peptidase [Bacteroidales bacterium]
MRRKIFLLLAVFLAAVPLAAQQKNYVISTKNAEYIVSEEGLRSQVEFLADAICAGRKTGTSGSARAAGWLGQRFEGIGLLPPEGSFYRGFRSRTGATGRNVIGFLPGRETVSRQYIVVTAHYDHLGILDGTLYPGADSNASGVTALLTLAEMVQRMKELGRTYGKTLIFVALDGKQQSLGGAEALWDLVSGGMLPDPETGKAVTKKDIALVINIDQVGATLSPIHKGRPDYLIMLGEAQDGRRDLLMAVNRSQRLDLDLGFTYYGSKDFTRLFYRQVCDQKVFLEHGVPAVLFTSGITLNNNKPYDDAASLDYAVMKKRIFLMFNYLTRIL